MKRSARNRKDEPENDRVSTVEFYLELAEASDRWVVRIRAIYMWVSIVLMLFLSLLVGIYVPVLTNKTQLTIWIQLILVGALIMVTASVWFFFLRKFDAEMKRWNSRIKRMKEDYKRLYKSLEDGEE